MKVTALLLSLFLTVFMGMASAQNCSPGDVCPALYQPVCGKKGSLYKTFGNSCELESWGCRQGWKFHGQGECA